MRKLVSLRLHSTPAGVVVLCCLMLLSSAASSAQSNNTATNGASASALPEAPRPQTDQTSAVTARELPKNILSDQVAIWTSPAHIRTQQLEWIVPLAATTALAVATDTDAMRHVVPTDTQLNHRSVQASNALLGALVLVPAVNLGYGMFGDHPHARETGLLTVETAVDSAIVEQAMKVAFWRERPSVDNARGKFWQSSVGPDSSFPSSHAVFAWSTAAVVASEYPSRLTTLAAYGMATGVSVTRVMGRDHFPSDVLVGSAAGWLVGHYVYKLRHRFAHDYDFD